MKKIYLLLIVILAVSGLAFAGEIKKINCPSSLVTFEFKNVKLKKVEFVDDGNISYKVINDSFRVTPIVKRNKITFITKDKTKKGTISLYLPKSKTYQTFIQNYQRCKFDQEKIEAEIGDDQKIIITKGNIEVINKENEKLVKIGRKGIYVNDEDELVKIDDNGIFIKSNDEGIKNYNGFWARLLAKTISGFTGLVMDLSLKDIGKNVVKIINEQNLKSVANKMSNLNLGVDFTRYQKETTKHFKIKNNTDLYVKNFNGDIFISKSSTDSLIIKALIFAKKEKNLDKISVKIKKEGKKIKINSKKSDQMIEGGVNLTISCPKKIHLQDIITSNGDISIKSVSGKLNTISSNGDIEIYGFKGDIKALTSNGDITAKNISGEANLITSNGVIDAKNIKKLVTAKSSNGKISMRNINLVSDIYTSNSNIYVEAKNFFNNTDILSSNGKITLVIPSNLNLSVKAVSSNGEIRIYDLPFKNIKRTSSEFKGILGNGKIHLTVRTSNNDIILKKN